MDKNDIEKYAIIGGGLATVALLALTYKNGQSSGGGQIASSVPVMLRSVSPQTVQLREIAAQTENAALNAKVEAMKIFAGFNLGMDTNAVGERVTKYVTDSNSSVTKYVSDNDKSARKDEALAALESSKILGETNRFIAEKIAWADQQKSYYDYEKTHQLAKSDRVKAVGKTVGDIVGGFLKFL